MTDEFKDPIVSTGLMPRISWAMYDFANTIYAFVVMTLAGVRYFDAAGIGGELFYGISFFTSMIVSGVVVPVIGAISDRIGHPKLGVIILTIIAVVSMFFMGLTQNMFLLCIFLFIGNLTFQCSLVLYDSLLPLLIKNNDEAGKVSGLGVGLGYLGSIVAAGLIMILLPNIMFKSIKTEHIVEATEKSYLLEVRDHETKTGKLGKVKFLIVDESKYEILPKPFKL
ncbi:MAG: MFS transporter, partial [Candidatus Heimdallarchaeota archaeon]|nr:MFS transporter [Candidatus Heimdallarchaeota archaeon]